MPNGAFHFIYNSDRYDETVAFYRDGLELPILHSWDEGPEARGTLFRVASGIVEVMAYPETEGDSWAVYPPVLPKGVSLAFEVDQVDQWYQSKTRI